MKIKLSFLRKSRVGKLAYTLAEVLVGTGIVGTVFVSLYAGTTMGFNITQQNREELRATQIMLERMEGIRLYNWNQLVYSNMIPTWFTNYYYPLAASGESKGTPYIGRLTVTNVNLSPSPSYANDMRQVTITIFWTNKYRNATVTHQRQMQTYVGRMGAQNYIYNN